MKTEYTFYKMQSAGNDFVLLDNREGTFPAENQALIRLLCHRHFGIGADGLMLIETSATADFELRYFNADGKAADMCGNGARCAVYLAHHLGIVGKDCGFEIGGKIYRAQVLEDELVKLQFPPPKILSRGEDLKSVLSEEFFEPLWLDTGVAHLVLQSRIPAAKLDVRRFGRYFREHPCFAPSGTNVNFVYPEGPHTLRVRVYERGVEDETLACGTGAVACGIYAQLILGYRWPVHTVFPGGRLTVEADKSLQQVFLSGKVVLVFGGQISIEHLARHVPEILGAGQFDLSQD